MITPTVLFKENYLPDDLTIHQVPSSRKTDPDLETKIQQNWLQIEKEALEQGKKIWDSEIYRLEHFEITKKARLTLHLSTIAFSTIQGMSKYIDGIALLGPEYYSKSIFANAIIHTSDNKFVIGQNSGITVNSHEYELIGGILSKSEQTIANGFDIFSAIHKELLEEVNILSEHIVESRLIGGILTHKSRVGLLFFIQLDLSESTVRALFREKNDGELRDVMFFEKNALAEFLNNLGEPRQVLIANEFIAKL